MRSPGFQWFVAWRYLMARPRWQSGIILVFSAVFAGTALLALLALAIHPLTDEYIASGQPVPVWLPVGLGASLSAIVSILISVAVRCVFFHRGRRPVGEVVAFAAGLVAFGLVTALVGAKGAAGAGASVAVEGLPLPLEAGLAMLAAALLVILCHRPVESLPGGVLIAIAVAGCAAVANLVIASWLVGEGDLLANLPGLTDEEPIWLAPTFLVPLGLGMAGLAAMVYRRRRGAGSATAPLRIALLGAALVPGGLAFAIWGRMAAFGLSDLAGPTGVFGYHLPVELTIPASVASVVCGLSLILFAVRYVFTFFTTVSIGGVAIGTMALVMTLSVMSGFETDLRSKILGSNAHVLITRNDEAPFPGYRELMEKTARVRGVVAQTPYLTSEVVIAGSSNYFNVVIKGIDPKTIARVTNLGQDLEDEEALQRIWPLAANGAVIGPPTDPPPRDVDVSEQAPIDWSGAPGTAPAAERKDPPPPDLRVADTPPIDWSGGSTEAAPQAGQEVKPSPEPLVDDDEGELPDEGAGESRLRRFEDSEWLPAPARELDPHVAAFPGVLVGRELQKQINLYQGQEVKIISPLGQNTVAGQTPYIKPYRVAGTFFTGMYEYDLKRVYVELGSLQDFLDLPDAITGIEIRVLDPEETEPVIEGLRRTLGSGYTVQDWKELNRSLFSALKLEKIAMFLVLAIIILVASFSIVGNLIMVVVEKAREIAVLKTLGASDSGVTRIFIVQGFFIGLVGTAIGVTLGLGACLLGERYGIGIPPEVYYIDRLPIHVEPVAVALVAAAGVLISVGATIYPAQIAARLRPVQGLRYE